MAKHDRSELLGQLLSIGQRMTETRALEPLLTYAVDVSLELLNAQYGFLVLIYDDGQLEFHVARDRHGNNIVDPHTQISKTIMYRVIETRKHVVTASAISDSSFGDAASVSNLQLKSVLCVPLVSPSGAIGVIYLENRNEYGIFEEADAAPLQYLAGHAAVCIENAILSDQLEDISQQRINEGREDNTGDKRATGQIRRAVDMERARILDTFMQDASHQFRTPLSVIKTSVDILSRKFNQEQALNYLDRIRYQVDVIVKLVDSLNLLAKLDMDIERNFHTDNIALIVRDMYEVLAKQAMSKNVDLVEHSGGQIVEVPLIQDLARQAIGQVLENAIMYTEAGGTVSLDVIETEEAGHIIISDTGTGIEAEELPLVTTRFYRNDKAGTTRGLGLGLTIVEKIMSAHDGRIVIDSKPGEGTRVELIFPKKEVINED